MEDFCYEISMSRRMIDKARSSGLNGVSVTPNKKKLTLKNTLQTEFELGILNFRGLTEPLS